MQLENYGNFPQTIPLIIEDEIFLYPFMITPLFLENQENIKAVENAIEFNRLVMIAVSKAGKEGAREKDSFYDVGVVGNVMRKISLPDGKVKVLFQGVSKAKIINFEPTSSIFATVDILAEETQNDIELKSLINILIDNIKKLSRLNNKFPSDLIKAIEENDVPSRVADLVSSVLKIKKDEAYKIFSNTNLEQRIIGIIEIVKNEIESYKIQKEITQKVNSKIEKSHKDYFLKEQIKAIQKELGADNQREEDIKSFKKRLKEKKCFMGKEAYKETKKQIEKLSRMNTDSPDASLLQTYVEMVLDIPFGEYADSKISVSCVEKQLNKDHYSLEKAKERIAEYFAVKQLLEQRNIEDLKSKGTVLCFVGPPGVGKTSLANSIANALARPLVRVALGGMEDVNELRG
ncbi:MAG: LON peptidase substrate-binding domain-containing protein, partial [Sulfurimonadaceae bacterium]|nr:LON peptidase substrate-binding domain-containing protein [Sulfurimonadaceae bacterium]